MQRLALILGLTLALAACGESAKTSDAAKEQAPSKPSEAAQVAEQASEAAQTAKQEVKATAKEIKDDVTAAADMAAEKAQAAVEETKDVAKDVKKHVESQALPATMFQEGTHYEVLKQPVRTITPGKIEVTEVFAYSCGHCFNFEPIVNAWKKTLPDYVQLVKSPAIWNASMEPHARMHFAAIALSVQDTISAAAFNAIHRERNPLKTQADIAKLFVAAGVDEAKFNETYNSFTVSSQVNQANARARSMMISATPEIVVDGRFRISTRFSGVESQSDMLKVANFLTNQIHHGKL